MNNNIFKIGLTGGIATGKTTVADIFSNLGIEIIDTDEIAKEAVKPGEPALKLIIDSFGKDIIEKKSKKLDRRKLRRIIFENNEYKKKLESILHPIIRKKTLDLLLETKSKYVIIVVPLLIETGFIEIVDYVIVVDCPKKTQLQRLLERDKISKKDGENIIKNQINRKDRLKKADIVIDTSKDIKSVINQVNKIYLRIAQGS
ncbi:MAG: dephospho-CoA kinase [Pseudomonadota bacterium]|nr:dephospho-CoA kinase [Gammaproteobacteria bacterium]MEE2683760.1 dephospho-CoA kinase [Pseudomonadota bacterium]|tara:strand:- start:11943 stop:12548 length:606 start_codon:yes stop_codon:yes gene_type:complete